eukprot:TRINITY_DN10779_c0_g1_i1.p1 TRINITY_DN10779_c0_g1~~TRINITY_DN10779_c0_g1_i1.p1  ORF type:complete len:287 (+),score=36.61 TRINITY_DN10779_c0_g1_i1:109-969(+)
MPRSNRSWRTPTYYFSKMDTHLTPRLYQALVKGILYSVIAPACAPEPITLDEVKASVFTDEHVSSGAIEAAALAPEYQAACVAANVELLSKAAAADWSLEALTAHLETTSLRPAFTEVLLKVWSREAARVHQSLASAAIVGPSVSSVEWRVDAPAASSQAQATAPRAVLRIGLEHHGAPMPTDAVSGAAAAVHAEQGVLVRDSDAHGDGHSAHAAAGDVASPVGATGTLAAAHGAGGHSHGGGRRHETVYIEARGDALSALLAACAGAQAAVDAVSRAGTALPAAE